MSGEKTLLAIVELGGYPDFSRNYENHGFAVRKANSMRKALALLKKQAPDVVVAEFIYGPTYGSQLSNFESLLATLQRHAPQAKLIAFLHKEDMPHLQRLTARFPIHARLFYPIDAQKLEQCLVDIS